MFYKILLKIWYWLFDNSERIESKSFEAKSVTDIHQITGTAHYTINVPGHPPRTESDIFSNTKNELIKVQDLGCWVCGTKENREVHHFHLEWSLANAADWNKVKALHPDFPDWNKIDALDSDTFKYFVDSVYNCRVICMLHHRQHAGIHQIPWPIWSFQLIKKDDFDLFPESKGLIDFPVDDLS